MVSNATPLQRAEDKVSAICRWMFVCCYNVIHTAESALMDTNDVENVDNKKTVA